MIRPALMFVLVFMRASLRRHGRKKGRKTITPTRDRFRTRFPPVLPVQRVALRRRVMNRPKSLPRVPSIVCGMAIIAMASAGPSARTRALVPAPAVVTGTGTGLVPTVRVFDESTGRRSRTLKPFGDGSTTGARVAVGDVNGDGTPDIVVATGPGTLPIVKILDGVDGSDL